MHWLEYVINITLNVHIGTVDYPDIIESRNNVTNIQGGNWIQLYFVGGISLKLCASIIHDNPIICTLYIVHQPNNMLVKYGVVETL